MDRETIALRAQHKPWQFWHWRGRCCRDLEGRDIGLEQEKGQEHLQEAAVLFLEMEI